MNISKLQSVLAKGGHRIGDIIFWQLADARVERSTLEGIWQQAQLDVGLLPEAPSAERALKQAVRDAQVGRRDRMIRLGLENEAHIVFAVVREHRDHDGNVSYVQEARVELDRSSEVLTSDRHEHEIVKAIFAGYDVLRSTHTSEDVRRAIVRALAGWAAVTLREGGGVYWVPAPYAQQLRSLQAAIEKLGRSRVHLLPVHQSQDAERSLGEIATASLEADLALLQSEIAQFISTPPDRASTLERRLDAFSALRDRAKLYRNVLSIQATDLDLQLDQMTATIETLLAQKQKAA